LDSLIPAPSLDDFWLHCDGCNATTVARLVGVIVRRYRGAIIAQIPAYRKQAGDAAQSGKARVKC
jgi:hypothetical protein